MQETVVMIILYEAIKRVCFHDVLPMQTCVEGTSQEEEDLSHHHAAYGTFLPQKRPQQQHVVDALKFAIESSCGGECSEAKDHVEQLSNIKECIVVLSCCVV
jgi:hypothetical protein